MAAYAGFTEGMVDGWFKRVSMRATTPLFINGDIGCMGIVAARGARFVGRPRDKAGIIRQVYRISVLIKSGRVSEIDIRRIGL
jgi:cytoskeletal protein CcmA (bactofilin family)